MIPNQTLDLVKVFNMLKKLNLDEIKIQEMEILSISKCKDIKTNKSSIPEKTTLTNTIIDQIINNTRDTSQNKDAILLLPITNIETKVLQKDQIRDSRKKEYRLIFQDLQLQHANKILTIIYQKVIQKFKMIFLSNTKDQFELKWAI